MTATPLPTAQAALIDALARQAVADYLRSQTAANQAETADRPKPVPLPQSHQAA